MPNPYDDYELFDQILIGTTWSPGRCSLSGHDRSIEWDVQSAPGLSGARITRKGGKPIEFTATFKLTRDPTVGRDDFADWDTFAKLIDTSISGKTPKALLVYHPDLARVGIKNVVKKSIGGMVHDGKGGASVACKFLEYAVPKAAKGSPTSKPAAKYDPNADVKKELDRLTTLYSKP